MQINLIYTGRSGRFKHNKTYIVIPIIRYRRGWKGTTTTLFRIKGQQYRITPYELKHFWKFKDTSQLVGLTLLETYNPILIKELVYAKNPLLELVKSSGDFGGALTLPLIYGKYDT